MLVIWILIFPSKYKLSRGSGIPFEYLQFRSNCFVSKLHRPSGDEAMDVDKVPGIDESQESIIKSSMDQEAPEKEPATDDLVLLDLVNASPLSLLGRIATLFTRVEDLSHVLAWGRPKPMGDEAQQSDSAMDTGEQNKAEATIVQVELPRLKLTFK